MYESGRSYPCDFRVRGSVVVGCSGECDLKLPAAMGVAARQLRIDGRYDQATGECRFTLTVLDESRPVFVDGTRVRKKPIEPGCVLRIGSFLCRFEGDGLYPVAPAGAVRVRGLSLKRPGQKRETLRHVTFDVQPGELFGIFGPSGCGKSTLMDCLRGELTPTGGWIRIAQEIETADPQACNANGVTVGFVPQDNLLYDLLTVEENLRTSARVRMPGKDLPSIEKDIDRVLKDIGLNGSEDRRKRCRDLSGGMRKRLNVGLELLAMPQILMLDEPTSGLDPAIQADFMGFLKELSNRGVTVICVTHALETLDRFDRVLLLRTLASHDATSMVFRGKPDELHSRYDHEKLVRLFNSRRGAVTASVPDEDHGDDVAPRGELPDAVAPQPARPFWPAVRMTFLRTWLNLWRNPLNATMVFALPAVLGTLVFLSQAPSGEDYWPDTATRVVRLTLTISALWMGMNLAVREIVSERLIIQRELRVGLGRLEYVTGKVLHAALFTFAQTLLLVLALYLLCHGRPGGLGATGFPAPFARVAFWLGRGAFFALWMCAFFGALMGLTISAWSKTQALAVTLIPLFLIPHLLFNRNVVESSCHVRPEHTYCAIRDVSWPEDVRGKVHLVASAPLVSRPAMHLMIAAAPWVENEEPTLQNKKHFSEWLGVEWTYLFILLAGHVLVLLLVFRCWGPGGAANQGRKLFLARIRGGRP